MAETKRMKVEYLLDENEVQALEELLPYYQNYISDGKKPFEKWTIENLFQFIMEVGSKGTISEHIKNEQIRQNIISSINS